MTKKILLLPGDGIGAEIIAAAATVLEKCILDYKLDIEVGEVFKSLLNA